eukprot:4924720-Prymnesium_polylepis.1
MAPDGSLVHPTCGERSLRAAAPAGRLESREVSANHAVCACPENARHTGSQRSVRGFGECRGPGFPQLSSQFVAARPRTRTAPGRSCIPNVCRARRHPRCQKDVGERCCALCEGALAHIVRDVHVCAGAAQKVLTRFVAWQLQAKERPCQGRQAVWFMAPPRREGATEAANPSEKKSGPAQKATQGLYIALDHALLHCVCLPEKM